MAKRWIVCRWPTQLVRVNFIRCIFIYRRWTNNSRSNISSLKVEVRVLDIVTIKWVLQVLDITWILFHTSNCLTFHISLSPLSNRSSTQCNVKWILIAWKIRPTKFNFIVMRWNNFFLCQHFRTAVSKNVYLWRVFQLQLYFFIKFN